ncbi:MAG: nucleotide exchange factor GrpE [Clostridia bacterium]
MKEKEKQTEEKDETLAGENVLQEEIEALERDNDELKDKLLRLAAEYDNFRKRSAKEKEQVHREATADFIEAFLPVIDSLEQAEKAIAHHAKKEDLVQGIDMIYRQFKAALDRMQVQAIPSVGEKFDPELHDAVMHVQDEKHGEGVVVEEFKKGYTYKEKVIRHSMVKVAN